MRPAAVVPILLSLTALVLSFLCLFAGSKPSFLSDYAIITLNTSEIGQNVLSSSGVASDLSPSLQSLINDLPDSVTDALDSAEDVLTSVAHKLGIHDFYSAHLMSYCDGFYKPGPVPNATLKAKDISKNVTYCSNRTAFFQFDPRNILQDELNQTTDGKVNISQLNWPSQIDDGLRVLHAAQKAAFILYCIAIGFISIAIVCAILSIFLSGRLSAFLNAGIDSLAFIAIAIASALVTVIASKAEKAINKYANEVGVSADKGGKFLALTWAATAAMFLCIVWWFIDCCMGRRRGHDSRPYGEKRPF